MAVASCSVDRYIPEHHHMLKGMEVSCDDEEVMKEFNLGDYVTQNKHQVVWRESAANDIHVLRH